MIVILAIVSRQYWQSIGSFLDSLQFIQSYLNHSLNTSLNGGKYLPKVLFYTTLYYEYLYAYERFSKLDILGQSF